MRWRQVEELYHAALERNPAEREVLLAEADPDLRREVESLLAHEGSLLDRPAWEQSTVTRLQIGAHVGRYRIEAELGAGGMGQVFRAMDTRLGRAVAIKSAHEQFSERFEREARAIAALNHPNICALYDVGPDYLVMELVDGETLAARLKKGKLSIADTLHYGAQIAEALAAAHAKGIVHRDLKPANVMLTKAGAKVLDFGIAKSAQDESLTASRMVVGTPAYMAPEQREGEPADARSDIYSLGLLLYEMATGARYAKDLKLELDQFAHVVERCLEPDPENRWQAASDVARELQWTRSAPIAVARKASTLSGWLLRAAALAGAAVLGAIVMWLAFPRDTARRIRFDLPVNSVSTRSTFVPVPAPDGSALIYADTDAQGHRSLWLRGVDADDATPLAGTDEALRPFWSPDGRWIGFYAQGKLKKIRRDGADIQTIAVLPGFEQGAWGAGGRILFAPSNRSPIFEISESGGVPKQITKIDESRVENSHRAITFLPDGRRFLFVARCSVRENNSLYAGSLDSGEVRRIGHIESNAAYVPARGGRAAELLFVKDGKLFKQPFDGSQFSGEAAPLMDVEYSRISMQAYFSVSMDGRVLVWRRHFDSDTQLTWFDRRGAKLGPLGSPSDLTQPRISPDGSKVVFNRPDDNGGNRDIWSVEVARGVATRLTIHPGNEWSNVWAPDNRRILFASDRDGKVFGRMIEKTSMDPGAGEVPVPGVPDFANPEDWSADGRWIAFSNGGTHNQIWIAPTFGDRKAFRFLDTPFNEREPRVSPDGNWIAYHSNESGRFEVYVRPFSGGPAGPNGKLQISEKGGYWAGWSRNGKELFFVGPDSKVYATSVQNLKQRGIVSTPEPLFTACPGNTPTGAPTQGRDYDVSADGQRFLFVCRSEPRGGFSVAVNWDQ